jgi:hypothetical protein
MVFNAIFNNISAISWWSVLFVGKTGTPRANHRPVASHWQTLSHNVVSSTPRHDRDSNSQVIDTDCRGWYKSNYHTIMTTTAPTYKRNNRFITSRAGTAYPSGAPPVFSGVRVTRSLVLCLCFVDRCLSFFFWSLCCLFFFDILILITPLVSSISS